MSSEVWNGIIVGGAGGASASIIFGILGWTKEQIFIHRDSYRIYKWLSDETSTESGQIWHSTHSIASYTNLTEARVVYICSINKRITRNSQEKEVWGIKSVVR